MIDNSQKERWLGKIDPYGDWCWNNQKYVTEVATARKSTFQGTGHAVACCCGNAVGKCFATRLRYFGVPLEQVMLLLVTVVMLW